MSDTLEARLRSAIDVVTFTPLAPHVGRGGLFLVSVGLDLAVVAAAIAENRTSEVEALIASGGVRRPEPTDVERYAADPERFTFRFVIVQPFVLAQAAD